MYTLCYLTIYQISRCVYLEIVLTEFGYILERNTNV